MMKRIQISLGGSLLASTVLAQSASQQLPLPLPLNLGGTGSASATSALSSLGAAPLANPNFTGTVTAPILDLSSVTGSTQCLQASPSGVVSGSGATCGSGGSGSGTVTSVTAGAGLSGGTITNSGTISLNPNVSVTTLTASGNASLGGTLGLASGNPLSWNGDTGLSRGAAGVIDVGTGAQGSTAGSMSMTSLTVSGQLTSTVATGTAPLVVASTTNVPNLNASSLNGSVIGTSGATIPLLSAANTWSSAQSFGTAKISTLQNYSSGHTIDINVAPTVSSGFGTSPTVVQNGTAAFTVQIGTTPGTTGVVAMNATVSNGWICTATDYTTPTEQVRETTYSTTVPGFTFYNWAGTATAPTAGDVVGFLCRGN